MPKLTHLDDSGQARMVNVGDKPTTQRQAIAHGRVQMQAETLALIMAGNMKKGDVLTIAQLAGVMAAKQTSTLIPLCHPLPLTHISVTCTPNTAETCIDIEALARVTGQTGVEMEALTAVSVAALTIYDMAKAVDRTMHLTDIRLVQKSGGQSGDFVAPNVAQEDEEQTP